MCDFFGSWVAAPKRPKEQKVKGAKNNYIPTLPTALYVRPVACPSPICGRTAEVGIHQQCQLRTGLKLSDHGP